MRRASATEIVAEDQQDMIWFRTPNGLPGQVFVRAGIVAPSQIDINVYRSGVR